MIHEESAIPRWGIFLILFAAFILIYPLWNIGMRDLFWDEGELAAIASEFHSFPPASRAHGELLHGFFPLFPMLAKILSLSGMSMELSLRFLSVLSLAGLTAMVGIIGTRIAGSNAGAAAAACMFTNVLVCDKAIEGYPQMFTVLIVFSGWMLWFNYGQICGNWNRGWIICGFFSGLAFYCGGWSALVYFYLPMMFLKRPFTPWRRMNSKGFVLGMAILLVFILFWLVPRWNVETAVPFFKHTLLKYFTGMIKTPWDIFYRLLPWSILIFAPFCPALIEIEKNPLFSKYLRVLLVVSAVLVFLSPFSRERDIMYLLPTFSLLIGLNYDIVTRRYGDFICRLLSKAAFLIILLSVCTLLFELLPQEILKRISFISDHLQGRMEMAGIIQASSGILCGVIAMVLALKKRQVWLILTLCAVSVMFCFWAVVNPYRAGQRSRSEMGQTFRKAIGNSWSPELIVYKDSAISGLYPECYYLGTKIKTVSLGTIGSVKEKEVYLLTVSSIQPPDTTRTWTKILDVIYKNQNLYMWKGVLNDRKNGLEEDIRNMHF